MTARSNIEKVVSLIGELPALPEIVSKVMDVTNDPGVAVSDVSQLIEQDPALTAKLLKVSNSSYYGMRQVVGTLKLALVILGVREVRNIVLGISVVDALRDSSTDRLLNKEGLWKHSTRVGSMAKKLGTHLELSLQGEDFIAGLLHDIGKLVLWKQMQDDYFDVYEAAQEKGQPLHEFENEHLGFDHADVASAVAEAWSLPESLSNALYTHHAREDRRLSETKDPKLSALIRIVNLADKSEFDIEDVQPGQLSACTDDEAWNILTDPDAELSVEERFGLLSLFRAEVRNAPELAL